MPKVLDLTTDCLLLGNNPSNCTVTHCQTGPSVMHSGCAKKTKRFTIIRLLFHLLFARKYDWIVVPPVHLNWTISNSGSKKLIKKLMGVIADRPFLIKTLRRIIFGKKTRFIVTDYSDMHLPSEFACKAFEPEHYFMLNIPRTMVGTLIGSSNTKVHYLPTVIQDDLIDSLQSQKNTFKEYDVFIAGEYHNQMRINQLEAAGILQDQGYKVYELRERSFEKFCRGILNSKLCFAAKGLSYHCFRPLEAASAGAAPVWHLPENDTYHDYHDRENCFLYHPSLNPHEIAEFVKEALRDNENIEVVANGALNLLNCKHRASKLSSYLWSFLLN